MSNEQNMPIQLDTPTFPLFFSNIQTLSNNQGSIQLKWLNKDIIRGEHFVWNDPVTKTEYSIVKRSNTISGAFNRNGSMLLSLHFKNGSYFLCVSEVHEPKDNNTILVPKLLASRCLPFDLNKFFISDTNVFMTLSGLNGSRLLLVYDLELNHLFNTSTTPRGLMVKIVHANKSFVYLVTCDLRSTNNNELETVVQFYYQRVEKSSLAKRWNNWETVLYGGRTFDLQQINGMFYFFTYVRVGTDRGQDILKLIRIDAEKFPKAHGPYQNYRYQIPPNCYVTVGNRFVINNGVCSSSDLALSFDLVKRNDNTIGRKKNKKNKIQHSNVCYRDNDCDKKCNEDEDEDCNMNEEYNHKSDDNENSDIDEDSDNDETETENESDRDSESDSKTE